MFDFTFQKDQIWYLRPFAWFFFFFFLSNYRTHSWEEGLERKTDCDWEPSPEKNKNFEDIQGSTLLAVLRNRNYFLRFRFRILTGSGSGSEVLTSYSSGSGSCKSSFQTKFWTKIMPFTYQAFLKEKIDKFHQIYCKMWMKKKMLNDGNQIHNFVLCQRKLSWFHYITVPVPLRSVKN